MTFSFSGSGNNNWSIVSGFGAYFTSGYGVSSATAGGSLKSDQILSSIPLGSFVNIAVSAATNSPKNTANLTMYGLDKFGIRLYGISASYVTPAYDSKGNLDNITNYAKTNSGILSFSASMNAKLYALELVIASASSKTLLAEISVS